MTTFFDTNALFAIVNDKEEHHAWSTATLQERKNHGPVLICDVVFAEFSVGMASIDDVRKAVAELSFERYGNNDETLFRAGKAFKAYRTNKGTKNNVLPDFMIGAAAEVAGVPLVTSDASIFKTYFPQLQIITPAIIP